MIRRERVPRGSAAPQDRAAPSGCGRAASSPRGRAAPLAHAPLRAEQRRMAAMAIASFAWLLGAAVIGAPEALGYLAPPLALLALLALGRYPGATAFERRIIARRARPAPRRARHSHPHRPPRLPLPRGGALLATGLAGRAPPVAG